MLYISNAVLSQYEAVLKKWEIPLVRYADYMKWLRYYLDFCSKYAESSDKLKQLRLYMKKLQDKKQTEAQRRQATHAVSLYFDMQKHAGSENTRDVPSFGEGEQMAVREPNEKWVSPGKSFASLARSEQPAGNVRVSRYSEAGYEEKSDSSEWDSTLATLTAEIKVRHYSR